MHGFGMIQSTRKKGAKIQNNQLFREIENAY